MFETVCLPKSSAVESHYKSLSVKVSTLGKRTFHTRLAQAFQLILTAISRHVWHFHLTRNLKAIPVTSDKKPLQSEWKILRIQVHKP